MPVILSGTLPMTADEKEWLLSIYDQRRKNLFFAGFGRTIIWTTFLFMAFWLFAELLHDIFIDVPWSSINADNFIAAWPLKIGVILLISSGVVTACYYTWILPYRQDALSGSKQRVQFTVTSKEYFPVTGQYFVWLEGITYKGYEVDSAAYNSCKEGGVIVMEQAPVSKYIFCENDSVRIKLFPFIVRLRWMGAEY